MHLVDRQLMCRSSIRRRNLPEVDMLDLSEACQIGRDTTTANTGFPFHFLEHLLMQTPVDEILWTQLT